jgi:hypothetical protein
MRIARANALTLGIDVNELSTPASYRFDVRVTSA